MSVAIVRDPAFHRHSNGSGHPERAERLEAIDRMIEELPFRRQLRDLPARDATPDELGWVHTAEHISRIEASSRRPFTMLDADTSASADSYQAALRAAGGSIVATECVLSRAHPSSFAFVRPPGHHAEADHAKGFCLFNSVAIAAEYARRVHGLRRIVILDWDVHHGNGTMHSFYASPEVLYVSLHQYPYYPGTGGAREIGVDEGEGYTVNVPFPGRQEDADYLLAFDSILLPVFNSYAPELFLVSAGFDAHISDPLADMDLSSRSFGLMTQALLEAARDRAIPIAMVLEGGYSVKALAEGVASVLETLARNGDTPLGSTWRPVGYRPSATVTTVLDRVRAALAPRWPCLRRSDP